MAERLRWSLKAADNLEEICSFIEQDNPAAARDLARNLFQLANDIPDYPLMGRVVPEFGVFEIRERILSPYRMVYRVKNETVEILAIRHSARRFPTLDKLME